MLMHNFEFKIVNYFLLEIVKMLQENVKNDYILNGIEPKESCLAFEHVQDKVN